MIVIDVGSGTQDILLYQPGKTMENCPKFIVPSRTQIVAAQIRKATELGQEIFFNGYLMGGGASAAAMKKHLAEGLSVYATPQAALTFHDDLTRVQEMGIILCEEKPENALSITLGDVDWLALRQAIEAFGLEYPQRWAVAVQDHGYSVTESNRTLRFRLWEKFVMQGGDLASLVFTQDIPVEYTRMWAVRQSLPNTILTDTGTAALLGIMADPIVKPHLDQGILAVNIGNTHVLGAAIRGNRVYAIFEHHTGLVSLESLSKIIHRFQSTKLTNAEIFGQGGHGATQHPEMQPGWEYIAVTGPRRNMVASLGWHEAAPYGDMMLTGCFGMLAGLGII